jgi:hypothetical protein
VIDEQAKGFGEPVSPFSREKVYDFLQRIIFGLWMGHFGAFCLPKPNKPTWPVPVTPSDFGLSEIGFGHF